MRRQLAEDIDLFDSPDPPDPPDTLDERRDENLDPPQPRKPPKPGVVVNGQFIHWSFVVFVKKACGGDHDMMLDAFWKAREKQGPNSVVRYIMAGLRPDKRGVKYTLLPSKERELGERGMQQIRDWWDTCVYERKTRPMSMKELFAGIAAGSIK